MEKYLLTLSIQMSLQIGFDGF